MVGHSHAIHTRHFLRYVVSNRDEIMNINITGQDMNLLALWGDIALIEGWNSVTPFVVCRVYEKHGNTFAECGKYHRNKDDALADWKERATLWGM
jgi:hypothetical protein